jgi:hypothetical protein
MRDVILAFIATIAVIVIGCVYFSSEQMASALEIENRIERNRQQGDAIQFIWIGDEQSIPDEDGLVRVEMIDENTVYLTSVEKIPDKTCN